MTFKKDDKVIIDFHLYKGLRGTIVEVNGLPNYRAESNDYWVRAVYNKESFVGDIKLFASSYLRSVPSYPNIGEHVVTDGAGGVNVGCTFVPDETIKKIAEGRGLIKPN